MMTEFQVFGLIISVLLSVVAFFTRQMHADFKKVEKDLAEVKTTTSHIRPNLRNRSDWKERTIALVGAIPV